MGCRTETARYILMCWAKTPKYSSMSVTVCTDLLKYGQCLVGGRDSSADILIWSPARRWLGYSGSRVGPMAKRLWGGFYAISAGGVCELNLTPKSRVRAAQLYNGASLKARDCLTAHGPRRSGFDGRLKKPTDPIRLTEPVTRLGN